MKRSVLFAVIFMLSMILCIFSGCGFIEKLPGDGNDPEQDQQGGQVLPDEPTEPDSPLQPMVAVMDATDRYVAEPVRDVMDDMISYRDEDHYYYIFYLGELNGVPLQDDADAFQFSGNPYTYSFQKEKSTSGSISSSAKRAVEYCTSWTQNFNIGGSVGIKDIVSIDLGYSIQWGESSRSSAEYSYEEAYNFSEKQASSFSISFDERYPVGYYRWIMFGDIDVYAAIEYDIRTGEYAVDNYSVIAAQYFTLDYSPTSGRFDDSEFGFLPFEMDAADIQRLPKPTEWITEEGMGGAGTVNNPYMIRTAEEFTLIRQYPDAYFSLAADISFANVDFEPIPQFDGTLNGNGYAIQNLSFTENDFDEQTNVGLFLVNNGNIYDLTLEDCTLKASPSFGNKDITVNAGAIAAVNHGTISECTVRDVEVIANSSDTADRFLEMFFEDPRSIVQGSVNWETWIRQRFYVQTNSWNGELMFTVNAGGIVGNNQGKIVNCRAQRGSVEANLYNMQVPDPERFCQQCYAGGIVGVNDGGTVSGCSAAAQEVNAWIEMSDDAAGMGWIETISPRGICYAAGLAGLNESGSVSGDTAGCVVKADARVYAAVYWFLQGAGYNEGNRANENRLTIGTFDSYAPDGN